MLKSEFDAELEKISDEAQARVVALMDRARTENADGENGTKPLDFEIGERAVDRLALTVGWIYDRARGVNRMHPSSMTKKIRKALGYIVP